MPRYNIIFKGVSVAQGKGVVEPDTVADDFGWESMTGVHEQKMAKRAEGVRFSCLQKNRWLQYKAGI